MDQPHQPPSSDSTHLCRAPDQTEEQIRILEDHVDQLEAWGDKLRWLRDQVKNQLAVRPVDKTDEKAGPLDQP